MKAGWGHLWVVGGKQAIMGREIVACDVECIRFVLYIYCIFVLYMCARLLYLCCICIVFVLYVFCICIVLYLCQNCRVWWGMTQALPLIDALTTLGWRLTSVGPAPHSKRWSISLVKFQNPSCSGIDVGSNFDLFCIHPHQREWGFWKIRRSMVKSCKNVWGIHS